LKKQSNIILEDWERRRKLESERCREREDHPRPKARTSNRKRIITKIIVVVRFKDWESLLSYFAIMVNALVVNVGSNKYIVISQEIYQYTTI